MGLVGGDLVDVSHFARTVGFVFPVALTQSVWLALVDIRHDRLLIERNPRVVVQRILAILIAARGASLDAGDRASTSISMCRFTSRSERKATGKFTARHQLCIQCDSGDRAEPIITISLAESDESDLTG
jgi:hypothetical protein